MYLWFMFTDMASCIGHKRRRLLRRQRPARDPTLRQLPRCEAIAYRGRRSLPQRLEPQGSGC